MIKINKIIEVAKIAEYNTNLLWKNVDIEAFVEMIKEDRPNTYLPDDGISSWQHMYTMIKFCITTFIPNKTKDIYQSSLDRAWFKKDWIAVGEYRGVIGNWYLLRTDNNLFPPYMR